MSVSALVVMGVSGSGKTTHGQALAQDLGWAFLDGDDLHSPQNVAKMAAGTPLTDEDRWPWLHAIAEWIEAHRPCVVACSALKRSYRDVLRRDDLAFVYLEVSREELERRLRERTGHYMPVELLDSQLATLEPPDVHERTLSLSAAQALATRG